MNSPQLLLDTDVLSAVIRKEPNVRRKARSYLAEHGRFTLSTITRYEILRGLKAKRAMKQTAAFNKLCARSVILPITDEIIDKAAEIYADLYRRGELIGDADILIASTALLNGLGVVSNNESHFRRVSGLAVLSQHPFFHLRQR